MPGGLTPLEYAQSRYPSERNLHEVLTEPPRLDEEEELELEQRRRQMYDAGDFADGEIYVYPLSAILTRYLDDDADEGLNSDTE